MLLQFAFYIDKFGTFAYEITVELSIKTYLFLSNVTYLLRRICGLKPNSQLHMSLKGVFLELQFLLWSWIRWLWKNLFFSLHRKWQLPHPFITTISKLNFWLVFDKYLVFTLMLASHFTLKYLLPKGVFDLNNVTSKCNWSICICRYSENKFVLHLIVWTYK